MKKLLFLLILLAFLMPVITSAQAADNSGSQNGTNNRIFGIHIGFIGGYDLLNNSMAIGRDFGLNFTLNKSIQLGFRSITDLLSTGDAVLLDFGYYIIPELCVDVMVGSDGTNLAAALDAAYIPFYSKADEIFRSSLRIKVGYIFETANGIDSGVINAGLVGTIGY